MKSLRVKSELKAVEKIRSFLREVLSSAALSEEAYYLIELSLLEMCINIVRYAYPQGKGDIRLKVWLSEGKVFFEIRDKGIPFDPRKVEPPDVENMATEGRAGGLGIFLSRTLMDGFDYRREGDENVLTMFKKIETSGSLPV